MCYHLWVIGDLSFINEFYFLTFTEDILLQFLENLLHSMIGCCVINNFVNLEIEYAINCLKFRKHLSLRWLDTAVYI